MYCNKSCILIIYWCDDYGIESHKINKYYSYNFTFHTILKILLQNNLSEIQRN